MNKSPFVVKPIKKYKIPRYPGWQDPNPLDHPDAAPYPFSKKVLRFLTAIGMTSAAVSGCSDENHNHTNDPNWVSPDSLRNTFTFEKNGLPYQSPFFGTGQPENIQRRFAIAMLENLARKEGFNMQRGYVYNAEGIKAQLDGWDPNRKTGFIFVDYSNSEDGIIGFSRMSPFLIDIYERDSSGRGSTIKYFDSWTAVWEHYDGHPQQHNAIDSLTLAQTNEYIQVLTLQFPQFEEQQTLRTLAFLKARFPLELYDRYWNEKKENWDEWPIFPKLTQHLQQLTASVSYSPHQQIDLYEDFAKAKSLILRFDKNKKMEQFWISLFSIPERSERQRIIRNLGTLYCIRDEKLQKRFVKALANPKIDMIDAFSKELDEIDQKTISLAEMHQLDQLAASGKAYIMPVSFMDGRFLHGDFWAKPQNWGDYFSTADAPPDFLDSLQNYQQRQAALPDSIQNKPKDFNETNAYDALTELERQARFYLRWAKSQGL